ncbi:MAG TPA: transaldolase family protein [Lacunisphaera sp.]|nr:transaldolase family protein [Lacunisphaera sp.]
MTALGADWWNDSGVPAELAEAVGLGAVGGTSNPVIVSQAALANPALCLPLLEQLAAEHPHATEDDLAWKLIHVLGLDSASRLMPVYERTRGRKGFLSMQVNPKFYPDPRRMLDQALELSALAPNIAIKAPTTEAGIRAMEEMVARGVSVNATVSFSVAQALVVSAAFERGLRRARAGGVATDKVQLYITLMIGRVDDQLKRVVEARKLTPTPGIVDWAGIAVFKQAHRLFKGSGRPGTLLAAAYRHENHWSQIIGPEVLQTVPYTWWTKFNHSAAEPRLTLEEPVDDKIVAELRAGFPDFVKAHDADAMQPAEFIRYGATLHTLNQFLAGYADLLGFVRAAMLK